jgi:hypothetical protein
VSSLKAYSQLCNPLDFVAHDGMRGEVKGSQLLQVFGWGWSPKVIGDDAINGAQSKQRL